MNSDAGDAGAWRSLVSKLGSETALGLLDGSYTPIKSIMHPDMRAKTSDGLTKRQSDVLKAIVSVVDQTGMGPSHHEICAMTGIKSTGNLNDILKILKSRGYLTWIPGHARSLRLAERDS